MQASGRRLTATTRGDAPVSSASRGASRRRLRAPAPAATRRWRCSPSPSWPPWRRSASRCSASCASVGIDEATSQAEQQARLAGIGVVAPAITQAVLDGDPAALDRLRPDRGHARPPRRRRGAREAVDARRAHRVLRRGRLIGERFELDPDDQDAFARATVDERAERSERPREPLRAEEPRAAGGLSPDRGRARASRCSTSPTAASPPSRPSGRELALDRAAGAARGLLVLQLANLALARWFAGRLRRGDQQRAALLHRALEASDLERRRIAADLHDGVVQDLTAVSLSVAAATPPARRRRRSARPWRAAPQRGERAPERRRAAHLLVEVYPPNLAQEGLPAALRDLADAATARGLPTELDVQSDFAAPDGAAALLFRAAQEGLRNAAAHSGASRAVVCVDAVARGVGAGQRRRARVRSGGAAPRTGTSACARSATCSRTPAGACRSGAGPGRVTVLRAVVPTP